MTIVALAGSIGFLLVVALLAEIKEDSKIGKTSINALLVISMMLSILAVTTNRALHRQNTPFTRADLVQGVIYEMVSEPVSYKYPTGGTLEHVFLSEDGGAPKSFRFVITPPKRFTLYTDKNGHLLIKDCT